MKGTVKFFNRNKAFGFIIGEDGTEYFVHQTGINEGVNLRDNDAVEFDVEQSDKGPKAVNVNFPSQDSASEAPADESSEDASEAPAEEASEAPAEEASEAPAEEASEAPAEEASEDKAE